MDTDVTRILAAVERGDPAAAKELLPLVYEELRQLAAIMDYRQGVMAEALTQAYDILSYFQGVFSFSRGSHPRTYDLMQVALRVAQFQVMYYKSIATPKHPLSTVMPRGVPPVRLVAWSVPAGC